MFSNTLTRAAAVLLSLCPLCVASLCLLSVAARAQQVADPNFKPAIARPAYKQGRGPRVLLDEAHHNFHTATGRYQPFAELLRRDGYVVEASSKPFTRETLKGARVLVIANALAECNVGDWSLPTPSAFTDERIERVATFTGSAFQVEGAGVEPLLVFSKGVVSLMSQVAWQFTSETPRQSVEGWYQGATMRHGKGRVALFGEAAMFTAQLGGPNRQPFGMNAPEARQNPQLLLNVLHWLSGKL